MGSRSFEGLGQRKGYTAVCFKNQKVRYLLAVSILCLVRLCSCNKLITNKFSELNKKAPEIYFLLDVEGYSARF